MRHVHTYTRLTACGVPAPGRVRGLLERNQYRSQTKATGHAIPSSPNAILSLPPRQAGGIVNLGKDVSREQRACHQASLGEAASRVSPQRQ